MFNEKEETETLAKILLPFMLLGFRKGVDQGLAQGSGTTKPADVFTTSVQDAIRRKTYEHAALAAGTTSDQIQAVIGKAIEEGWSVQKLAKGLEAEFQVASRVRSLRIARTELTDTINDGTNETLRKEGHQYKEWSTVIDGRERETHAEADGQVVGIQNYFRVGGASCAYPGDDMLPPSESINCRCTIVAANMPLDRRQKLGEAFLRLHGSLERRLVIALRRHFVSIGKQVLAQFPT